MVSKTVEISLGVFASFEGGELLLAALVEVVLPLSACDLGGNFCIAMSPAFPTKIIIRMG